VRTVKPVKSDYKLDDLFGAVSFQQYPNTVPFAKVTNRNNILGDLFDNSDNKPSHSSASIAPRRGRQPQQVFVSNNK
jgi:male germ cell-associated kinase